MKKESQILRILENTYPEASCELIFNNPFELLVATILSAQTTDKKVNNVTAKLFRKYKTPDDFLTLSQDELEKELNELGLYRNKAKNILLTCRILKDKFNSKVPNSLDDLISLPGVGRKTANVVLSNAFNIPAMAVDTHVLRVSNRLGIARSQKPEEVEVQLTQLIPPERWTKIHHQLIWHGRRICSARKPNCAYCPLETVCPSSFNNSK